MPGARREASILPTNAVRTTARMEESALYRSGIVGRFLLRLNRRSARSALRRTSGRVEGVAIGRHGR